MSISGKLLHENCRNVFLKKKRFNFETYDGNQRWAEVVEKSLFVFKISSF